MSRAQTTGGAQPAQLPALPPLPAVAPAPQTGVSVSTNNGGEKIITVPNRKGGVDKIVVNRDGIVVNGLPLNGTTTIAPDFRDAMPTGVVDVVQALVAMVVLCVVGLPLARAFARWLDRRGNAPRVPSEVLTRLANIENAVETVAVEVERISEGQRFTAKLLSDRAQAMAVPAERL